MQGNLVELRWLSQCSTKIALSLVVSAVTSVGALVPTGIISKKIMTTQEVSLCNECECVFGERFV